MRLHSYTKSSWQAMKRRCNDKNNASYYRYGALGITYPEEWETFNGFLKDLGERPVGTTLDRLENVKSYSKDNCKWSTAKEQASNRSLPCLRKDNKPGLKGVYYNPHQNKYYVQIQRNNRVYCLGHFVDFFDACCTRKYAELYFDQET